MENTDLFKENPQLTEDAVLTPGIDIPFPLSTFNDLEMEGSAESLIVLDKEEDKENPPPSIPKSEYPSERPRLLRCRLFVNRIKN